MKPPSFQRSATPQFPRVVQISERGGQLQEDGRERDQAQADRLRGAGRC